jgi:hypothetical protein
MGNTNYIAATVKLLECPRKKVLPNQTFMTDCRACLPQVKQNKVIYLSFWGKLAQESLTHYQVNDYFVIDGLVALESKPNSKVKKVRVTVLKIYPLLLSTQRSL